MSSLAPLHITVPRSARYYMIGTPSALVREVWFVCHGYGQLAAQFAEPFVRLEDTSRLLIVPEALSRFYLDVTPPHTPESSVGALWMTREDREAEIDDIVSYLDALYHRVFELLASHRRSRDTVHVHALGFSQGAASVSRWAARGAAVIEHLIVWGSGIPTDVSLRAIHERRPPFRIDVVYGQQDHFITPAAVAEQEAVLAVSGVPYRVRSFLGGHSLNGALLRELMEE